VVDLFESTEVFFGYYQGDILEGCRPENTMAPIFCIDGSWDDCVCRFNKKVSKKAGLTRWHGISDRRNKEWYM